MYYFWLGIHILGIFVAFAFLYSSFTRADSEYKVRLYLVAICALVAIVSHTLYIMSDDTAALLAFMKIEFLGRCFVAFCSLLFILQYYRVNWSIHFTNVLFFVNISALCIILTCDYHDLFYRSMEIQKSTFGTILSTDKGPLYYLYTIFTLLEMFLYIYICIKKGFQDYKQRNNRFLLLALFFVGIIPLIGNILYLTEITKYQDTTALGIIFSCALLAIAIERTGLTSLVKNAKNIVVERLTEGIIVVDKNWKMLYANQAAYMLFPKMLQSTNTIDVSYLKKLCDKNQNIVELYKHFYKIHSSDLVDGTKIKGHIVSIIDVTDMMEETRIMRELKDKAESANQAKSVFVSNISHEIRTPMNVIVGMTEILLRSELPQQEKDYLMNIKNSGDALLSLINDILDFSKIEAGRVELINEKYELASLLNDLGVLFLTRIDNNDVELIFDIDDRLPDCMLGDVLRIRQIIINLVNNAIKFTEHGHVCLTVTLGEQTEDAVELLISVKDTGQGIHKDDLHKLFDSFSQVDTKRNRNKEGTGLGLSISKQLIELMGGSIHVESVYGEGSKFYFNLWQKKCSDGKIAQVRQAEDGTAITISGCMQTKEQLTLLEKMAASQSVTYVPFDDVRNGKRTVNYLFTDVPMWQSQEKQLLSCCEENQTTLCVLQNPLLDDIKDSRVTVINKPFYILNFCQILNHESLHIAQKKKHNLQFTAPDAHILIVDDNKINLKVSRGLLSPLMMQIDTAESAMKAIEMVQENDYDIVFMDHMMPIMDGVEATQKIRQLPEEKYQRLPIVALSANAIEGAKEQFLAAGMNDFVAKPIKMAEICKCIKHWLPKEQIQCYNEKNNEF